MKTIFRNLPEAEENRRRDTMKGDSEMSTAKQVPAASSIREELREWGCTLKREDGLFVWRDSQDNRIGVEDYLSMATAQAYAVMIERKQAASVQEAPLSGYTVKIDKNFEDMAFIVAPDGRVITTGSKTATSHVAANLLNQETIVLQEEILTLKAALEKQSRININLAEKNAALSKAIEGVTSAMSVMIAAQYVGFNEVVAWRIILNQALQTAPVSTETRCSHCNNSLAYRARAYYGLPTETYLCDDCKRELEQED